MKTYFRPLLILMPALLACYYYLSSFSKRSELSEISGPQAALTSQIDELENVRLQTWLGLEVKLRDLKEPFIILHFWASWCAPCIQEFPELIQFAKVMKGRVQVLAISEDSEKKEIEVFLKSFKEADQVSNFNILLDHDHSLRDQFLVSKLPESFIFDSDRRLIKKVSGAVRWLEKENQDFFSPPKQVPSQTGQSPSINRGRPR